MARRKPTWKRILIAAIPYILMLIVIIVLLVLLLSTSSNEISYQEFLSVLKGEDGKQLQNADVAVGNSIIEVTGRYTIEKSGSWVSFSVIIPKSDSIMNSLFGSADISGNTNGGLLTNTSAEILITRDNSIKWDEILPSIISIVMILIISGSMIFLFTRRAGDMGMTKSKAKRVTTNVKFKDVAGYKEEKEELEEIVDFLKNPKRYFDMGARPPRGVLLSGPPGTGKTLLAKAVSGEAEVSFFFVTGSEFDDMFVGVGANRVKDLFAQAKKAAPAIIFIDEIDALGAKRGNTFGFNGRDQTINQFLAELDGFETSDNIVVIGSTNKPESLDPALLRSGRFDRKIIVPPPDLLTRIKILKLHAKTRKTSNDIDFEDFARRMPGFTGADIENMVNEAALLAVRHEKKFITIEELEEAIDRVIAGPSRKSKIYDTLEKEVIAIHEAGHAVVGVALRNALEVEKITLVPRGMAGGYTLMNPINEKIIQTKEELNEKLAGLLGGRAAVEIIYGENKITTGAQNDIERVTKIAFGMVTQLGMSDLGTIQYGDLQGYQFLGSNYNRNFSDATAREIDLEVKKIVNHAYKSAKNAILKEIILLKNLTTALIKVETIVKNDILYIQKNKKLPPEIEVKEKNIDNDLRKRFDELIVTHKENKKD